MPAQRSALEKFTHSLLATTCLTAASGSVAMAGIITEGTAPAPNDFSNVGPGFTLPIGTTSVIGTLSGLESSDSIDWFEWTGVSGNYSVNAHFTVPGAELGMRIALFDATELGAPLQTGSLESSGVTLTGSAPLSGKLVAEIYQTGGLGLNAGSYTVDFSGTQSSVPEPSTFGLMGLPLAGALAWRRRRKA